MLAYLVIREGSKWTDVFRLVPGHTVTIGRAATNQIIVKDERCSRNHAEIFATGGHWILRDLGSRNGTLIGGQVVEGDRTLDSGDVIRIANFQMAFVHDLAEAFGDSASNGNGEDARGDDTATVLTPPAPADTHHDSHVFEVAGGEAAMITHRRDRTRYLAPADEDAAVPQVGRSATMLCRLAFELARQPDIPTVANLALAGVFDGTRVDAGGVLLAPRGLKNRPVTGNDLEVVASRSDSEPRYHRVAAFLANTVLREGEAVLARNVADDSALGNRDSKGEIHSTSVICAPIRLDQEVIGLIHTYSTREDRQSDPEDLEFTLAVADNLALALRNLERQQELAENLSLTQSEILQLRRRLGAESEIIGSSAAMLKVQEDIAKAASSRATVLIRGESGVGKELVARAVHYAGSRRKGPYVCLNCAALTETLLESELFGHERGAFTGATDRKIGKFEAAHQGTLLLDEIGEMSPSIQAKFLRVLEGHPFERVGGSQAVKVDVRVIAATNRDLEKAVAENKFRRDLYFRLRVLEVHVPPLRKRPADIIELASHFLEHFNAETGRRIRGFSPEALEAIHAYRWPGNVRELRNVIERSVVLARGDYITPEDLALTSIATASESGDVALPRPSYEPLSLADIERRHIRETLRSTGWNKSRAAGILGIERSTLDRKIRRYRLTPDEAAEKM